MRRFPKLSGTNGPSFWSDRSIADQRPEVASLLSQGAEIGDHVADLFRRKFSSEGRHLASFAVANARRDLFIAPVQVMEIRAFVAARVRAMAMRAVLQEQLPAGIRHGRLTRGRRPVL